MPPVLDPTHDLLLEVVPALKSLPGFLRELRAAVEAKQTVQVLPNEHLEAALSELAMVLRNQPAPAAAEPLDLSALETAIEALGERMAAAAKPAGFSIMGGGGGAREETLLDLMRGITDVEDRLDFDGRTDTQPVYIGRAINATATTDDTWAIEKTTYDESDRPVRKQVLTGAWDSRASLSWS